VTLALHLDAARLDLAALPDEPGSSRLRRC
jgi:hypothetical protein